MRPQYARTPFSPLLLAGLPALLAAQLATPAFAHSFGAIRPELAPVPVHERYYGPQSTSTLSEPERVTREISVTDHAIATAEGRVTRATSEKAHSDYRNARLRQNEAKDACGLNFYARAARLTLEARAYVKSALIQAGPSENDPAVVARAISQTDDALGRAREILEGGETPRLKGIYEDLRTRQESARQLYKNGALRGAYAETKEVRNGVLDLLRQCADLPVSRDTARKALRRAERVMSQSKREIGPKDSTQARELEREAEQQLARARSSFERESYRDALLHAKLVERHLQRAMEARRLATNQSE
jgi:hypothetical protein